MCTYAEAVEELIFSVKRENVLAVGCHIRSMPLLVGLEACQDILHIYDL